MLRARERWRRGIVAVLAPVLLGMGVGCGVSAPTTAPPDPKPQPGKEDGTGKEKDKEKKGNQAPKNVYGLNGPTGRAAPCAAA